MSETVPSNAVQANGSGVITDAELNSFVQTCQTAPQLRAFVGITGMAVMLQGIVAPGDGGGGLYYWSVGTSYTDNNGTVIVPPAAAGQGAWLWAALRSS